MSELVIFALLFRLLLIPKKKETTKHSTNGFR